MLVHCDGHVALFVFLLDIPMRLDHVLQRVAPIDDCPVFPRLDEILEEEDILPGVARRDWEQHTLV